MGLGLFIAVVKQARSADYHTGRWHGAGVDQSHRRHPSLRSGYVKHPPTALLITDLTKCRCRAAQEVRTQTLEIGRHAPWSRNDFRLGCVRRIREVHFRNQLVDCSYHLGVPNTNGSGPRSEYLV